eukprot:scaffold32269_cov21-Tisochrysis_lutea.AAC.1
MGFALWGAANGHQSRRERGSPLLKLHIQSNRSIKRGGHPRTTIPHLSEQPDTRFLTLEDDIAHMVPIASRILISMLRGSSKGCTTEGVLRYRGVCTTECCTAEGDIIHMAPLE